MWRRGCASAQTTPGTTNGVAVNSVADGSDSTQGAKADAACAGSGSASLVGLLKGLYDAMVAVTPAVGDLFFSISGVLD